MSSRSSDVVMVIEDDDAARELVDTVLTQGGFRVIPFRAAHLACDMLEKTPPQAVVMDVNMPEMTGIDLMNWMRRRGINLPVVVVTAAGDRDTVADVVQAGASDILLKPFDAGELTRRVRAAMVAQPHKPSLPVDLRNVVLI